MKVGLGGSYPVIREGLLRSAGVWGGDESPVAESGLGCAGSDRLELMPRRNRGRGCNLLTAQTNGALLRCSRTPPY